MRCMNEFDSKLFGRRSFSCIKEQCPYELRIHMMKAYMVTPFVVNQIITMLIKTGLPRWIHSNLIVESRTRGCRLGLCKLLGLIFGHGGMRFNTEKCPIMKVKLYKEEELFAIEEDAAKVIKERRESIRKASLDGIHKSNLQGLDAEHKKFEQHKTKLKRRNTEKELVKREEVGDPYAHFKDVEVNIESIMEENVMFDFKEFNEQLEITLQFGWIMLFSAVFPLGSTVAMINNTLEMRSDTYKLTHVSQRPVPTVSNGIGSWEHIIEGVIRTAVVVNVAIMAISLNAFKLWDEPVSYNEQVEMDANGETRGGAFDKWTEIALLIFIVITVFEWFLKIVTSMVPSLPQSILQMKKDRMDELFRLFAHSEDLED